MDENRILAEDSIYEMARKIFNNFTIHQSCTIIGWIQDEKNKRAIPKGDLVIQELIEMDKKENCQTRPGDGRIRRKRVMLPDTIGGYVAQKIFQYKRNIVDSEPRISIWRIQ